jgi:Glycosyl transferase family 64 domain
MTIMVRSSASADNQTPLKVNHEFPPPTIADNAKDRSSLPRRIVRIVRSKWNRLSLHQIRMVHFLVLPLIACYLTAETVDTLFPTYGLLPERNVNQSPLLFETNEFVVVINTYQRPQQLRDATLHYAETCGPSVGVQTVYIVWAEEDVIPPTPESFLIAKTSTRRKGTKRATIQVLPVNNSLNSRFLPINSVQDMAVFMVDDDIRVDCQSLRRGFDAWKQNPSSMVGYYPRLSLIDDSDTKNYIQAPPTSFIYHSWPIVFWRQELNFILTKACFLHSQYMSLYSDPDQHPIEILSYIDQYFNCEDVAMSLLVSNITKLEDTNGIPARPIYVEGNVVDKGLFNGISTGTGHMTQRSKCLKDISAIYKSHGWEIPLHRSFSLRQSSWRRHLFWWQSRPSNLFEWFALSNIFK